MLPIVLSQDQCRRVVLCHIRGQDRGRAWRASVCACVRASDRLSSRRQRDSLFHPPSPSHVDGGATLPAVGWEGGDATRRRSSDTVTPQNLHSNVVRSLQDRGRDQDGVRFRLRAVGCACVYATKYGRVRDIIHVTCVRHHTVHSPGAGGGVCLAWGLRPWSGPVGCVASVAGCLTRSSRTRVSGIPCCATIVDEVRGSGRVSNSTDLGAPRISRRWRVLCYEVVRFREASSGRSSHRLGCERVVATMGGCYDMRRRSRYSRAQTEVHSCVRLTRLCEGVDPWAR